MWFICFIFSQISIFSQCHWNKEVQVVVSNIFEHQVQTVSFYIFIRVDIIMFIPNKPPLFPELFFASCVPRAGCWRVGRPLMEESMLDHSYIDISWQGNSTTNIYSCKTSGSPWLLECSDVSGETVVNKDIIPLTEPSSGRFVYQYDDASMGLRRACCG